MRVLVLCAGPQGAGAHGAACCLLHHHIATVLSCLSENEKKGTRKLIFLVKDGFSNTIKVQIMPKACIF